MLAVDDAEEPPVARTPRTSVMLVAELQHFGIAEITKHRIRDISAHGVRIDGAAYLTVGEPVAVSVGDVVSARAEVVWCRGQTAGLRFEREIDVSRARARVIMRSRGQRALTFTAGARR
jgi:hypothetical protein